MRDYTTLVLPIPHEEVLLLLLVVVVAAALSGSFSYSSISTPSFFLLFLSYILPLEISKVFKFGEKLLVFKVYSKNFVRLQKAFSSRLAIYSRISRCCFFFSFFLKKRKLER